MPEADNLTISHYLADRIGLSEQQSAAWHDIFASLMAQLEAGHTLLENNEQRQLLLKTLPSRVVCSVSEAAQGNVSPLVIDDDYIWLHRIWQAEYHVVKWIITQLNRPPKSVDQQAIAPFLIGLKQQQAAAVKHALISGLTIINGGPGTGKTYTIAKLVQALLWLNPATRIKLAAPTGKAANRMDIALHHALPPDVISQLPAAKTIHSLLGIVPGKGARFDSETPLDVEVLIIDEASMLSLELMQRLVSALPERAQVILLGDANQLAAVEPGAVLHDMTHSDMLAPLVITLTESNRFKDDSVIGELANATLAGDEQAFFKQLAQSNLCWRHERVVKNEQAQSIYDELFAGYQVYVDLLQQSNEHADILQAFEQYRILCAGRAGHLGSEMINNMMRQRHLAQLSISNNGDFYHGQPIMVLVNQPHLQLYNGDIGLCLHNEQQQLSLYFPHHDSPLATDRINRKHIEDAYAFSIHKSQGSEFEKVAVCLDQAQQRLMSRELLYTAMTRAKKELAFYGTQALFTQAINTPTERLTGIAVQLANAYPPQ